MDSKQIELKQSAPCLPGFEGVEKNLKVDFYPSADIDCRRLSRTALDTILTEARCTIIGYRSTAFFDAYVLSESSLFVYPHKMILKTCGTTRLLSCLPVLLNCAKQIGAEPVRVQFSRCNFIFPHVQPAPHCSFDMEVESLDKYFSGTPYILGPLNGPRWHLYSGRFDRQVKPLKEQVFEIAMFELDRDAMKHFYCDTYSDLVQEGKGDAWKHHAGELATVRSGIASIFSDFSIDWYLFTPCGYSCNALKDEYYFTIHITPEPHCSFVSFETNVPARDYAPLIAKVLAIFRPGRFCVLTAEEGAKSRTTSAVDGFTAIGNTQLNLNGARVVGTQFVKSKDSVLESTPSTVECDSPDSVDSPSSDTDADVKDQKKKKRRRAKKKKRCKNRSSSGGVIVRVL